MNLDFFVIYILIGSIAMVISYLPFLAIFKLGGSKNQDLGCLLNIAVPALVFLLFSFIYGIIIVEFLKLSI